ncbi:lantibiotic dehydratase [Pedobacter caeni]|uniref:Thiopeptide-type bacteriocin biosynthesis domain-containing protein n=1 Tax=Pedobacter caeni TaxID=288992 RepID=A0A1M5EB05_9SPHI|nr:lantibiotic dehydratase [Pedobacter caeni]SHF76251.1 thiopeptide-type bacteriocin biosynthesis domain-containing protein [Pedobacter caeni]
MQGTLSLAHADYYLLRRPLLPVNVFFDINELVYRSNEVFEQTLLDTYKDNPVLMEAIYTASPELYYEFCKVINGEAEAGPRLILTLYKYLSRMSTRCTPYGLFAGCSTGMVNDQTLISYQDVVLRKESRLDMNYVNELINHLQLIPELKRKLAYSINTSLYSVSEFYRYIAYKIEDKKRHYTLASVRKNEFLDLLIQAADKELSYEQLLDLLLVAAKTVEKEEVEAFLDELIESQILISELEPTITGGIYMDTLVEKLAAKVAPGILDYLTKINFLLKEGGISAFEQVHEIINDCFGACQSKDLIQTDLFFEHKKNQLNAETAAQITSQLSELYRLSTRGKAKTLDEFKRRFNERFEGREIPLLQALDGESGIGYGSLGNSDHLPLLEGIVTGVKKMPKVITWTAATVMVNKVFKRAMESTTGVGELFAADLEELETQEELEEHVPASSFAFGSIVASSAEELDAGNYLFSLSTCSGPSAANILARFCHGDQVLYKKIQETLAQDEQDDENKVYAELVHLPESRIGNILIRPEFRNYEIPFLGRSVKPLKDQIRIQDIMVSVREGKVILRSVRLNKIVIPRLSTAHNYTGGLPVYRFLCDLQQDDLYHSIYWDWDNLSDAPFLPRVVYKNIIISKASWVIKKFAFNDLSGKIEEDISSLSTHLEKLKIPRYVCITEHDNELLIDTHNYLGRTLVYQQINKKGAVKLTEFLYEPENCFIKEGEKGIAHEILLPLSNKRGGLKYPETNISIPSKVQRTFIPGSEWTYFKVYGGTKTTERALVEKIRPYLKLLIDQELIKEWFFIRYTDPHHHIRLRLKTNPARINEAGQVISGFYELFKIDLEEDGLYRIQLDTYVRELERYGAQNIENSEALFYHDSVAITEILNMIEGDVGERYRWLLAARGLDELMNDFGLKLEEKINFFDKISEYFFKEHNGDKKMAVALNEQFRTHSKSIRSFLDPAQDIENEIEEATAEFAKRTEATKELIEAILALHRGNLLADAAGFNLLSSYIHMFMNRFFPSEARLHELTLYTLMKKYYLSQQGIQRRKMMSLNLST